MANFRRDTRKTRVMRNPIGKACLTVCTTVRRTGRQPASQSVYKQCTNTRVQVEFIVEIIISLRRNYNVGILLAVFFSYWTIIINGKMPGWERMSSVRPGLQWYEIMWQILGKIREKHG